MTTSPEQKLLPRQVDPRKLVSQGATFNGFVPTREMERLTAAVVSADSLAAAELRFSRGDEGFARVDGSVELNVELECQRCLKPVASKLSGTIELGIVWDDEQAKALPKHLEPWLVSEESELLYDMVEDELLLALPIIALHDKAECQATGSYSTGGEPNDEDSDSAENPFGILAQLKNRQ